MFYSNRILAFLALLAGLLFASTTFAQSQSTSFKATTRKPADKVEFVSEGGKLIVNVFTVDGIGSATIKCIEGKWPRVVMVRFHLKNLEHIQISDGTTTIESHLGEIRWHQEPHQHDSLKASIRKTGEIIEAEIPGILLRDTFKEIVIEWINAYR